MALSHSPSIITQNLILCLDAANSKSYPGSGTTWTDLSGNGNNGTLVNGVGYNSGNLGSLSFDGVDDRVDVADNPFRFSNTFSISSWIYWNGVNQFANVLSKRNEVSPFNQYGFTFHESPYTGGVSNKISFFARRDGGGSESDILLQYALPSSGWYNIFVTMSSSNQSLYVNGVLRSFSTTDTSTFTYNISNKIFMVGTANGSNLFYNGNIAQVSIYNRALTASEIQQNFNATRSRFGV